MRRRGTLAAFAMLATAAVAAGVACGSYGEEANGPSADAGVGTVAIHFRSVGRKVVVEVIELDERGRAIRGSACHGSDL